MLLSGSGVVGRPHRSVFALDYDDGSYPMKAFFLVLLAVSVAFPLYSFSTSMRVIAHNQWKGRSERLVTTDRHAVPSAHLGLTAAQLTGLDELVASAYKDAVYDGYRLGSGYEKLSFQALGLDALLFVASIVGLVRCRDSAGPTSTSSQPRDEPSVSCPKPVARGG